LRLKCLSDDYIDSKTKLRWECKQGHQWEAVPSSIKSGRWCPVCGRKQSAKKRSLTIDEMHKIANEFGGKCLSYEYINCDTKLLWECANGHQWWTIPYSIKKGHWCPVCARNIKSNIEEMQKLAEDREAKCLSKEYISTHSKLIWECKYGHKWEATPANIKRGSWCPECYNIRHRKKNIT